ncbi:MAG: hypothetical protein LKF33_07610 [Prevotella sp.]|jgi:hypothetical protein|nr:hypothetical protein [Prevotella sp.]
MKIKFLGIIAIALIFLSGCNSGGGRTSGAASQDTIATQNVGTYKLYPTQNMWNFLKLNTRNGKIKMVQFTVQAETQRFQTDLNTQSLVADGKEYDGRFELYPTQNMFNFLLLDKYNGKTWQVQWSFDESNRALIPIQ